MHETTDGSPKFAAKLRSHHPDIYVNRLRKLTSDIQDRASLQELVSKCDGEVIDWSGWRAIDAAERQRGEEASRPRVKFVDVAEMLAAAKS